MARFARYWDLVGNSGNFVETRPILLASGASAFDAFLSFSDWLYSTVGRSSSINLKTLVEFVFDFLVGFRGLPETQVGEALARDYLRGGRVDLPRRLAHFRREEGNVARVSGSKMKRQRRVVGENAV